MWIRSLRNSTMITFVLQNAIRCKPLSNKNREKSIFQLKYSRVIGSLVYLMSYIKPNIARTVSRLSIYTSHSIVKYRTMIVRVLRWLRYTQDYELHYTIYPVVLESYSDTNWISNINDSKSTSRYVFILAAVIIS